MRVSILLQCVNFPLFKLIMFLVVILISNKLHSESEEENSSETCQNMIDFLYSTIIHHQSKNEEIFRRFSFC